MAKKTRGLLKFQINNHGKVISNKENLDNIRRLFLDRRLINKELLGPGNKGYFDVGAWHILCHLAAGCAVFKKNKSFYFV